MSNNYLPEMGKISCHFKIWCNSLLETPFHEKFLKFHQQLTKHYDTGGAKLYDPAAMEEFCNKHAPGMFYELERVIRNDEKGKISERRATTQRQRVVAMLHQFSYFRNQVSW